MVLRSGLPETTFVSSPLTKPDRLAVKAGLGSP
jgi:hypothetical protein